MCNKTAVIVSGYFNPIHKGHIEYFNRAKELGDFLIVIVNSDLQREIKGSKEFQDELERLLIVKNIKAVDDAMISLDSDRTVRKTITEIHQKYKNKFQLIFANGGDQSNEIIPERNVCEHLKIKIIDGLGAKIQSSSWLLDPRSKSK